MGKGEYKRDVGKTSTWESITSLSNVSQEITPNCFVSHNVFRRPVWSLETLKTVWGDRGAVKEKNLPMISMPCPIFQRSSKLTHKGNTRHIWWVTWTIQLVNSQGLHRSSSAGEIIWLGDNSKPVIYLQVRSS